MPSAGPGAGKWQRHALRVGALLLALGAAFEGGRWVAGYSVITAMAGRAELESRIDQMTGNESMLRRELASAEVGRRIDREATREAQRMLGELQAEVARQQQELQFYRGVLAREFGAGTLRVQELTVRTAGADSFVLSVMLVQAGARDTMARGELALTIDGTRAGALARLPLADVTGDRRRTVPFSLRYFQALEVPVTLPAGFVPASVTVELRSSTAGTAPERRTFPWRPAAGDTLTPRSPGG